MNCILQSLAHTPILRDYFMADKHTCHKNDESKQCLVCEMAGLYQEVSDLFIKIWINLELTFDKIVLWLMQDLKKIVIRFHIYWRDWTEVIKDLTTKTKNSLNSLKGMDLLPFRNLRKRNWFFIAKMIKSFKFSTIQPRILFCFFLLQIV